MKKFYNSIPEPPKTLENCISDLLKKIPGDKNSFPEFGKWNEMSDEDFWRVFVEQILVRREESDKSEQVTNHENFSKIISLNAIRSKESSKDWQLVRVFLEPFKFNHLSDHIKAFKRNSKSFVKTLVEVLQSPYLGDNWSEGYELESKLRDILVKKVCGFREKSASDYLITIGFARFLIALDTHITRILREKCGWNGLQAEQFQRKNPEGSYNYRFVEGVLVNLCQENFKKWQLLPSQLDRVLFRAGKYCGV